MKPTRFQLKIEHLWGLAVIVGIFAFVNTHPIRPQDFWWHVAIGREIVTTGKIPTMDVYSFTEAGQPYPSYQMFWLMESFLYQLYRTGGPALVILIHSLLITIAYGIIFWICQQQTRSWRIAAFCLLIAAALGLNDWNVRPQGITFLLASSFLLAIAQYRKKAHWYWLVVFPLGMLIWANSHGTFLIGLILIALWWGQELWDAIILRIKGPHKVEIKAILTPGIVLIITILACLLNPRGIGIVNYLQTLTGSSVIQNLVTEWAPPTFHTYLGIAFFSTLLLSVILVVISPKRPSFLQVTTLIAFGLLGIRTSRGIVWFGLVIAPILADHISAIIARYRRTAPKTTSSEGSQPVNLVFSGVMLLMAVVSLPWFKSTLPFPPAKAGLISAETPLQATQFLMENNLPANLFNSMSFGSYLIWAAYPQYHVFVDTRIELFSEKVWMDYLNISNAEGDWETLLEEYQVNTLFLSPVEQEPLIGALNKARSWQPIYQDNAAVIFSRVK